MKVSRISGVAVIDKNIIIHAYLKKDNRKREVCRAILVDGFNGIYTPVITNHILYELLLDLTHKYRLDEEIVKIIVDGIILSERWMKIDYRSGTLSRAKDIQLEYGISTSASLIIATMEEYNIKKIVSDRDEFIIYPYIEVINPFK